MEFWVDLMRILASLATIGGVVWAVWTFKAQIADGTTD